MCLCNVCVCTCVSIGVSIVTVYILWPILQSIYEKHTVETLFSYSSSIVVPTAGMK